jgi:DNA-binding response OmpR family regulator/drug/metabolite transporter (DMT)-like permease
LTLSGTVLVVDDNRLSRRKLTLALQELGHRSVEAESGEAAFSVLRDKEVDLILLDILMPVMDGFQVLLKLADDPILAEIPVLVISGLEDDASSVARAIEMGATDFLPKHFDAALFRARVNACIEKRRFRQAELDHLKQVDRLIAAAEMMETSTFHPAKLGLQEVADRTDAVGKLGRVFRDMAEQVYARERQMQRNLRTVKGAALLMVTGVATGLGVPLSIMLYQVLPTPTGNALWVNLLAGLICLTVAAIRGQLGWLPRAFFGFLLAWAALNTLSTVILFEAAGHVTGIMLSIILALQGFSVFMLAAILRIESPSARRFLGLCVGLAGVLVLLLARDRLEGMQDWMWIVIAVSIPLIDGLMDILVDRKYPETMDPMAGVGVMLVFSALLTLPFAMANGQVYMLSFDLGWGATLILVEALRTAVGFAMFVKLIAVAGAVFGSQSAYVSTLAGIGWSILLLGETLSLVTVAALALIVLGLALVGTKREAEDTEVRFRPRRSLT